MESILIYAKTIHGECTSDNPEFIAGWNALAGEIDQAPTIDAVEVVRCRECAYMHVPRCCPYQIAGFKVDDDWYCPMGVRREPDGE